jgi:hypothetical protein
MPRRSAHEEEWEEDEWDEYAWNEDEEPTVPCPYCHREIHEDTIRCPHCEQYISAEDDHQPTRKPWWLYIGVLVCLYLVYRWIAG